MGAKPTLPSAVLAYAVLDFVDQTDTGGSTVTLSRLAHESGAPGKAFKLTDGEIQASLEPIINESAAIALTTTTGDVQLSWSKDPREVATEVLDHYYGRSSSSHAPAGEENGRTVGFVSEGAR